MIQNWSDNIKNYIPKKQESFLKRDSIKKRKIGNYYTEKYKIKKRKILAIFFRLMMSHVIFSRKIHFSHIIFS